MKNRIYSISVFLLSLLAVACYDDKGNYDYTEISQVEMKGIEKEYVKIAYRDVLHIEADVTSDFPNDTFLYLWTLNRSQETESEQIKIKLDTIGDTKVLDYPMDLRPGFYDLTLRLTNERNGHQIFYNSKLSVGTQFSRGFYVLKEMENATELDLHLPDKSVMANIIEKSTKVKMLGKPVSLGLNPIYSFINSAGGEYEITKTLNVCTETDVNILNINDMSSIFTHKTMFHGEVPAEKPYYVWFNLYGIGYMSDQGTYFSTQCPAWELLGAGKFGYPALIEGGCKPNINGVFSDSYFFFDELKGRFLWLDWNGGLHDYMDLAVEGVDKGFYPNGIRHKLIFFGRNNVAEEVMGYAIFEDVDQPGKHYLYKLALSTDPENPIESVTPVVAASKLNSANLFAINEEDAQVIYFVKDNQLYMYDLNQNTEEMLTPVGLGSGETITYLSNRYWKQGDDKDHLFNYLAIGTYKDGKYKVYLYNMLGGKTDGAAVQVLEGTGKVVKMQYVSPNFNGDSFSYFPGSF
ncbi:MAG: PKD-like family lipoprotein [Odoribacter sp.]